MGLPYRDPGGCFTYMGIVGSFMVVIEGSVGSIGDYVGGGGGIS